MAEKSRNVTTHRLLIGFSSIILLLIVFGVISLIEIRTLSKVTRSIYDHPLVVSSASLRATVSIIKMHRSMKDVAFFNLPSEINIAINAVNEQERMVFESLDTVKKNILGDEGQKLENEARHLFANWKPLREEVIKLVREGQKKKAAKITMEKEADYVAKLENKILELTSYARNKATGFMLYGEKIHSRAMKTTIILISIMLLLSVFIAFIVIRRTQTAEEALQESEAFTKAVLDNLPIGIAVNSVDPVVKFEYMNDNFPKFYRATREKLSDPDAFWDAVYEEPEVREEIKKRVLDDCASGDPERMYWVDVPITRKGEETSYITAGNIPVPDKQLMLSTVWDVTERKQAEEALRESEEKYRTIFENIQDVYYEARIDGTILEISPSVKNVSQYNRKELIGKSLYDIYTNPKDRDEFLKLILDNGKVSDFEIYLTDKDGSQRPCSISTLLIRDEQGNPIRLVGSMRDVSERKQAENERERFEAQLQQIQKMEAVGTLAGGIAHDFNNILFAIFGYTELALDEAKNGTLQHQNLQEVLIAGGRAKDLVQQILTFSRQADQEQKPVQVKLVVKEALKLLRASIPTTIEIEQNVQSDTLVMGDSTQIHQILMNLCTNAAHAMEDKGGLLTVNLSDVELDSEFISNHPDLKPGRYINLTVTDTGHGISTDVLKKMFDPFFTTKEKGEGTGMGLSVIHGIVRSHGGTIYVYSEPGKGSTFKVYLPAIERSLKPEDRIEKPIATGTESVLLVDDEPAIVNIGKQVLESLGYNVVTRTSSIEALEYFKAQSDRIDLVITDMTMPKMTGEVLANELMRVRPDIPVIVCTGFSTRIDEKKAKDMGIRAFVPKPVLKREIAETIRMVLDEK
jgi:PAS domain S-box-containing protein